MRGYLLDTNHVGAYFRQEASVIQKMRSIPADWQIRVCTITLGEIEAGHLITQTTDQQRRDDYKRFLNETFSHNELVISIHTGIYYAKIVAAILRLNPFPSSKMRTEEHLVRLGVDMNDLWTTAAAWEHNLTLVTHDHMACIRTAVGSNVQFDCWLAPIGHSH